MPAVAPSQLASDYDHFVIPKAMEADDIRRVQADWVRAAKARARRGLRHRLRLRRPQLPAAAVPLAVLQPAHGRVRRLAGEPGALLARDAGGRARGGRRRLRDRRAALRGRARPRRGRARGGARVHPPRRSPRGPLGRERRLDHRVVEGLGRLALLLRGLPARVDRPRARGDCEADRRRRPAHEPRPDGGDRPLGRLGPDRRSTAVDRRPLPAQEGRGGPLRRDPRVHRLQHLHRKAEWGSHIGCTQNATAGEEYRRGWHPERFERAENADRDVLVVGAGPAGMECAIVLGKRGFRRVHLVDAEAEIGGCMRWIPQLPGLGEWAPGRQLAPDPAREAPERRGDHGRAARRGRRARRTAPRSSCVATGARWAGDGLHDLTHAPIPGADASLAHVLTPEQVMLEGKRPAGEARGRLRRRGLLHRRGPRRAARRRGSSRWSS